MRKILLSFFLIFVFFSANSQIKYGINAGIAVNNQTGFAGANKKSLVSGRAAIFGMVSLSKLFFLQPSVGYCPKGSRIADLTFEDQFGNPIGTGTMNLRFDYIELTLPFQYLLTNNKTKLLLGAGPYFSFAISGKEIWKNISGTPGNEPTKRNISFKNNGYKRFDVGFVGLLSVQMQSKYEVSANYEFGITNIYNSSQNKIRNLSGGITLGYFFN